MPKTSIELIGHTPLVRLARIWPGPGELLAKAEFLNPGGSLKDRAALWVIQSARREGRLAPGQTVVEMTSGNMGAGLALVCAALGHPFIATMSAGNSPERSKIMRGFGAQVVLVPQVDGNPGQVTGADIGAATVEARDIAKRHNAYYVDQFNNPGCYAAHENTTGPEIHEELQGRMDAFVACVGTGGGLIGVSRYLKQRDPRIQCHAVEPAGAEILAGRAVIKSQHLLQGTGYGFVPPLWDSTCIDGYLAVTDDEARTMRERLGREEGLYVGYSAAANVAAAVRLLESSPPARSLTVVTLLCDTGMKY